MSLLFCLASSQLLVMVSSINPSALLKQPMKAQLSHITQSSHTNHQPQVRLKNRVSQILIGAMTSSWMRY